MSATVQTTVDQSGITRTADGSIAATPGLTETKTEPTPEPPKPAEPAADGTTLLTKKDEPAPEGAPEKYEDFSLPEGFEADTEALGKAQTVFKELGLPQAAAQKIIDLYAENVKQALDAPTKLWADTRKEWVKEVEGDKEIGGKLKEVKTTIGRAIDTLPKDLGTAFREAMDFTGVGDNPAFVKAFYHFSQKLVEGRHVAGGGPSKFGQVGPGKANAPGPAALYPNLPSASGSRS